jgi:hypothetical protein
VKYELRAPLAWEYVNLADAIIDLDRAFQDNQRLYRLTWMMLMYGCTYVVCDLEGKSHGVICFFPNESPPMLHGVMTDGSLFDKTEVVNEALSFYPYVTMQVPTSSHSLAKWAERRWHFKVKRIKRQDFLRDGEWEDVIELERRREWDS